MSTSPDAHPEAFDHTADSGQLEGASADADTTADEADSNTVQVPAAADRDTALTETDQPIDRHEAAAADDELNQVLPAPETDTVQQLGHHALAQPAEAAAIDTAADEEDGVAEDGDTDDWELRTETVRAEPTEPTDEVVTKTTGTEAADEVTAQAADVPRTGPADGGYVDHPTPGTSEGVVPVSGGDPALDTPPAAAIPAVAAELEAGQAGEADDLADEQVSEGAEVTALPEDGDTGDGNGSGSGGAEGIADDAPEDKEPDDTDGDITANPVGRGDDIDYDLADYIDDKGKGNADPALVEHERVMAELQDRIDHANRMADHIQHAQDLEALGGFVDPYLADAAKEASEAVQAYLNRYPDEFEGVSVTPSVEDDVTRWAYDTPDTDTVPPLTSDTGTDIGDDGLAFLDDPDVLTAETLDPFDFRPDDDTTIDVGDVASSIPMPDDPKGGPKTDYDEVKTLGGAFMEKVWGRLSQVHERVVTRADDRTIERLRILDKTLKVDLYKITRDADDFQRSAYYLATGRTGFRGGIQRGFREQQPVSLKRVHGSDIRASNIIARQTRRQDVIHNTRGSVGLRTFAQVVKSTYDAKRDAHQSKLIYKHERTNARYDLARERQALHARMAESKYEKGPRGDRTREAVRAEFRELRDRERDLRQHHRNVQQQGLGHRAVRTGGRLTGRAAVGSAKLGYKAAKGGARHGYKAVSHVAKRANDKIGDIATNRAAERNGTPTSPRPAGTPRPPRDPGTPRSPVTPRTPGTRRGAGGGRRAAPLGRRGAGRPPVGSRPPKSDDDSVA